ncbi:MFS family permease [Saccharothrix tamanrassetensis]|uniref:MFS family permease n=1 Tax=Saccharothrix tamanrassetensis TaxID=1051531 RepID=A0A841CD10_9PSEU|nr:hypothetical protein [Saccharothrix tamanrassetensis]MBB5953905.1 MFS family permease [Saccharothrix tamanrassetensis]
MAERTASSRPLRADRDFTVFWAGQTLSELGNSFALVALPLLVLLCAAAVAVLAGSGSALVVAGAVLGYAFGMALAGISSMSLRQSVTPDHLLGRVTSAFWTVHTALAPLGASALTALVAAFGVRGPLLGVAVVLSAVVVVGLFTPIRSRYPELEEAARVPA